MPDADENVIAGSETTAATAEPGRKPGRNSPCPCGCGRKYKVCRREKELAAEIAAAEEREKMRRRPLSSRAESRKRHATLAAMVAMITGCVDKIESGG